MCIIDIHTQDQDARVDRLIDRSTNQSINHPPTCALKRFPPASPAPAGGMPAIAAGLNWEGGGGWCWGWG